MKRLIVLLLPLLLANVCHARGTPDQDPVVRDLRARFETGTQPDAAALAGTTYECSAMMVLRDDFEKLSAPSLPPLRFSQFDGYLVAAMENATFDGQFFVGNGKEYVSSMHIEDTDATGTMAFRVDAKGFLVGEWSLVNLDVSTLETPALAESPRGSLVGQYALCMPQSAPSSH